MKKILLIVAGTVIVLLAAAVLLLPTLIDWNSYKATIAERLGRSLGREVHIAGDLSLSLLPRPTLTAEQVRIGPAAGGVPVDLSSLDALRLRLALLPLLRGRAHAEELVLVAPVVRVLVPDGAATQERATDRAEAAGPAASPRPGEPPSDAAEFLLRRLVVTDGRIVVQRGEAAIAELADVDGELTGSGGMGPFRVDGAFDWRGTRIDVKAATGDLSTDSIPVSLALHIAETPSEAKVSGHVERTGERHRFRGKATVEGDNFAALLKRLADVGLPAAAAAGFAFDAQIEGDTAELVVDDADLRIGKSHARGTATMALSAPRRAQMTLVMAGLDLDRWLASPPPSGEPVPPSAQPQTPAPAAAPAIAAEEHPPSPGMTVDAEITADTVVYRGAALRKAQVDAGWRDGVLSIRHASVQIPGPSQLTVSGTLRKTEERVAYDGTFDLGSDNLRAILAWLDVDASAVPADRLRLFAASGKASGDGRDIRLSDLDVSLDSSRLAGAVTLRPGARLGLGANIRIDQVDVDSYLPPADAVAAPAANAPTAMPATTPPTETRPAAAPALPAWAALLTRFDANVKADIGQMTLNAVTLHGIVLDATLFDRDLTLRKLAIGDGRGMSAEVAGALADIGSDTLAVRDLTYRVRAERADEALRMVGWPTPPLAARLGALALTGTLDGNAEALAVEARAETAGGVISMQGSIATPLTAPRYDVTTEASHADFAEVVRLFAPGYRASGRLGGFALASRISGDRAALQFSDLRARLGTVNVVGTARLELTATPRLDATLDAGAIAVDAFLPAERAASLQAPQPLWLGGDAPVIPVAQVTGSHPGPRPGSAMAAAADQQWSRDPMDFGWLDTMNAAVRLSSPAVTWDKFRVDDAALVLALQDGRLAVERFGGPMFDGQFALAGHLSADGEAAMTLRVDKIRLHEPILRTAGFRMTSGLLSGNLQLHTEGRSRFEMVSRLRGEGAIDSRDGTIHGIDLGAVSRRLSNIDKLEDVLALLQLAMGDDRGTTPYSSLTGTFKVANGIVTSNDLGLQANGGTAQGVATVNLPAYTIDGRVVFRLTEHPKAPPFVMLVKGPLDSPQRSFDSQELQNWLLAQGVGRVLEQDKIGRALEKAEEKGVPRELLEGLMQRFGR